MKYPAIGISPLFRRGGGYNATTTAWIARVVAEGGSVTTAEAIAVNTLTNSIPIEEFDRLWVHGLQNQIAARTSILLIAPISRRCAPDAGLCVRL